MPEASERWLSPADEVALCRLKYSYLRLLDLKCFEELGALLTDDVTAAYEGARHSCAGRAEVVAFLSKVLGDPAIATIHQCHHPEFEPAGPGQATGVWYLHDTVVAPAFDIVLTGTAFYHDRYRLEGGRWRIAHTGYERVTEERRRHTTGELVQWRTRFTAGPTGGRVGSGPAAAASDVTHGDEDR